MLHSKSGISGMSDQLLDPDYQEIIDNVEMSVKCELDIPKIYQRQSIKVNKSTDVTTIHPEFFQLKIRKMINRRIKKLEKVLKYVRKNWLSSDEQQFLLQQQKWPVFPSLNLLFDSSKLTTDLELQCRTCMRSIGIDDRSVALFRNRTFKELNRLDLKINRNDGLPQQICFRCATILEDMESFRFQATSVQNMLRTTCNKIGLVLGNGLDEPVISNQHIDQNPFEYCKVEPIETVVDNESNSMDIDPTEITTVNCKGSFQKSYVLDHAYCKIPKAVSTSHLKIKNEQVEVAVNYGNLNFRIVDDLFLEPYVETTESKFRHQLRDKSNPLTLSSKRFIEIFKVSKDIFNELLEMEGYKTTSRSTAFPKILKIASTLRFLGDGSYQQNICQDFVAPMSQSTLSRVIEEITELMELNLCKKYIDLSMSDIEKRISKKWFYDRCGIPGIVGVIDGMHINIVKPRNNDQLYYDYNRKHSINAMVICDYKMMIRAINAKFGGASHNSVIWDESDAKVYIEHHSDRQSYLLGNTEYPLQKNVLTPYRHADEGSDEAMFNEMHSKGHHVIDRVFNMLKGRFRCLSHLRELHYAPEKAAKIMNVCCALHNMCILYNVETLNVESESEYYPKFQCNISSNDNIETFGVESDNYPKYSPNSNLSHNKDDKHTKILRDKIKLLVHNK